MIIKKKSSNPLYSGDYAFPPWGDYPATCQGQRYVYLMCLAYTYPIPSYTLYTIQVSDVSLLRWFLGLDPNYRLFLSVFLNHPTDHLLRCSSILSICFTVPCPLLFCLLRLRPSPNLYTSTGWPHHFCLSFGIFQNTYFLYILLKLYAKLLTYVPCTIRTWSNVVGKRIIRRLFTCNCNPNFSIVIVCISVCLSFDLFHDCTWYVRAHIFPSVSLLFYTLSKKIVCCSRLGYCTQST